MTISSRSPRGPKRRKLRILSLLPRLVTGGAEKQCILLADSLRQRGHDVSIGTLDLIPSRRATGSSDAESPVHAPASLESEAQRRGIEVCHFPRTWRWDPVPILEISKFCDVRQVDIVHSWLFLDGFYGRLAAAWARRVRSVAAMVGLEYEAASFRASVDRAMARWTGALVADSQWMARHMTANGFSPARITIVPTGIDVDWLLSEQNAAGLSLEKGRIIGDDPMIGAIARLHPVKDLGTFLRACAIISRDMPNARFLIAGDGPERRALEELAAQLGLTDRIFFAGEVADVRSVLRRIDVFALPSLSESCPNALLEAMAFGLPCVATAVGGVPEIIEHGTNGLLCPAGNATELAGSILLLIRDKELRRKVSSQAARTVRERFAVSRLVKSYLRLYRRLVA